MAKVYILYVGIVTALALCKYCMADWNATSRSANGSASACPHHGDGDNCTDTDPWGGHFSKCPESLTNYCIHGECRYVEEQQAPSCRCQDGFVGSRCEFLKLPSWAEKRHMIISCIIVVLLVLIIVIVGICVSAHVKSRFCCRRRRRREAPSNGTEKLSMMDAGAAQTTSTTEAMEMTSTHAV